MTKNKIRRLAILYKSGPVKHSFEKQTQYHKTTQKENPNFGNPTQIVGFHLQGLQTVAFVLVLVFDTLGSHQAGHVPQSYC